MSTTPWLDDRLKDPYRQIHIKRNTKKSGYAISGLVPLTVSFPSVTTVLGVVTRGEGLLYWAAKMGAERIQETLLDHPLDPESESYEDSLAEVVRANRYAFRQKREKAAARGSSVHALVAGEAQPATDEEWGYLRAAQR